MIIYDEQKHTATCPRCGWWHLAMTYEIGEKLIKQHQEGTMPDFPKCRTKIEGGSIMSNCPECGTPDGKYKCLASHTSKFALKRVDKIRDGKPVLSDKRGLPKKVWICLVCTGLKGIQVEMSSVDRAFEAHNHEALIALKGETKKPEEEVKSINSPMVNSSMVKTFLEGVKGQVDKLEGRDLQEKNEYIELLEKENGRLSTEVAYLLQWKQVAEASITNFTRNNPSVNLGFKF